MFGYIFIFENFIFLTPNSIIVSPGDDLENDFIHFIDSGEVQQHSFYRFGRSSTAFILSIREKFNSKSISTSLSAVINLVLLLISKTRYLEWNKSMILSLKNMFSNHSHSEFCFIVENCCIRSRSSSIKI